MTDQQINEAIASVVFELVPTNSNVPNYCADLNAMHEAEKTLNDELYFAYANRISEAAYRMAHGLPHVVITRNTVSATARQRAEAFLRTIGKWKEESK
jgi:hypothetical protein